MSDIDTPYEQAMARADDFERRVENCTIIIRDNYTQLQAYEIIEAMLGDLPNENPMISLLASLGTTTDAVRATAVTALLNLIDAALLIYAEQDATKVVNDDADLPDPDFDDADELPYSDVN